MRNDRKKISPTVIRLKRGECKIKVAGVCLAVGNEPQICALQGCCDVGVVREVVGGVSS